MIELHKQQQVSLCMKIFANHINCKWHDEEREGVGKELCVHEVYT